MKRLIDPRLWLAVASLAVVVLLALRDVADPGPGPLHPSHASIASLEGRSGCVLCHGDTRDPASMMAACFECHVEIEGQLADGSGLHGLMESNDDVNVEACARCHGEHLADAIALVSDTSFVRGGFTAMESFDHAGLSFELSGSHDALDCKECHPNSHAAALADGELRFLGLQQDCTACHEDPHGGSMTQGCAECHGQSAPFETVALFEHTERFPLEGVHGEKACAECHEPDSAHSFEASGSANPPPDRACSDCHASPHESAFLASAAVECAHCHGLQGAGFADVDGAVVAPLHSATGFPLESAHAAVECAACHDAAKPFAERYPGRGANDCTVCHSDPHGGQFAGGRYDEQGCVRCHEPDAFVPSRIHPRVHEAFGFALEGAHASADCSDCHVPEGPEGIARFRGTARACVACHDDVHAGAFDVAVANVAAAGEATSDSSCALCHGTEAFTPLATGTFDHGRWTGFALEASHEQAECAACHGPSETEGRRFGRVADVFPGSTGRCDTCHENTHGDRFDLLAEAEGGSLDCVRCHQSTSFRDVLPGSFDHGAATGFALDGAHSQASCTSCHVPPEEAVRRLGRVHDAFPGPAERCVTCHADPHLGAFAAEGLPTTVDGAAGCARCHQPLSFRVVRSFDHGLWTGWPLEGAHADAQCTACHALQKEDEFGRATAHAAGTRCADCHQDPHLGQFNEPTGPADCSRCHQADGAFTDVAFDHDTARFALDDKHADLACASCHVTAKTVDGRRAVRYRPLGRECADCHDPTGRGGDGGERR